MPNDIFRWLPHTQSCGIKLKVVSIHRLAWIHG
jgi:hypothetical protein